MPDPDDPTPGETLSGCAAIVILPLLLYCAFWVARGLAVWLFAVFVVLLEAML